jgi:nucleoside-diphosphate-sugar epimerase
MILLTGASGFIGKYVAKKLLDKFGYEQLVLLTSKPIEGYQCVIHAGYTSAANVFNIPLLSTVKHIIHLGAFTPKNASEANQVDNCQSNITFTLDLLKKSPAGLKTFVFTSTLDVYKNTSDTLDEQAALGPLSLYGYSKLYGEKMAEEWCKQHEVIFQNLRIGHVYGPGEEAYQKIIPVTINKVLAGQNPEIWGSGNDLRTFIHVEDIADNIVRSLSLETYAGPINLVGSKAVSIKELVAHIIELSGKNAEIVYRESSAPTRNLTFDNTKMVSLLGPETRTLAEGIKEEIEHMAKKPAQS